MALENPLLNDLAMVLGSIENVLFTIFLLQEKTSKIRKKSALQMMQPASALPRRRQQSDVVNFFNLDVVHLYERLWFAL